MRIYIHTSFLVELFQEYCLTSVLSGLGGLRGDVTGVGNPLNASKDPSADLGNISASFGASQPLLLLLLLLLLCYYYYYCYVPPRGVCGESC